MRWAWRYTVCSAWKDTEAVLPFLDDGQKEALEERPGLGQEELHETKVENLVAPSLDDLFGRVKGRIERLDEGDVLGAQELIGAVISAGLDEFREAGLWKEMKTATGMSIEAIRAEARRQRGLKRDKKAEASAAGDPKAPVFVRAQDKVLIPGEGMITRHSFVTARAREHQGSREKADEFWLTGTGARAEQVHDLTYDPAFPPGVVSRDDGVRVYNTYRPSTLRPSGDGSERSVERWLFLLDALDLEEGKAGREGLLDWFAALVQHPERKLNHGLLFGGAMGIGKDSLLAPVLQCVGEHNVRTIGGDDMIKGFNGWQADCKLAIINEIDYGDHKDRRQVTERLKRVLCAPPRTLRIDEKNLKPYEIPNRIQVVAMSNHRQCIEVQRGDRRWYALWCGRKAHRDLPPVEQGMWEAWFAEYYDWLEKGGGSAVMAYLRGRSST
jgi:hypothetical protein